jgi:hypothetical protein
MKKLLLLFAFFILYTSLFFFHPPSLQAQNLVPNPSFEDTISCPTGIIQTNKAKGWIINVNSVDYFNSCASSLSSVSVPKNCFGYQMASKGNAYCGLYNYIKTSEDAREYIGTRLLSQLIPNQKYYVSFKASWADGSCASNKLGALFSNTYYGDSTSWGALIIPPPLINNFAHVYTNTIITDTVDWTTITGSFIADSSYQYIYIGNFFKRENTDTLWFFGGLPDCKSYYYIDEICVSIDSLTCNAPDAINENLGANNEIKIYPIPTSNCINIDLNSSNLKFNSYKLFDVYGRLLKQGNIFNNAKIDVSDNKKGVYFLQIKIENQILNKKIIIN